MEWDKWEGKRVTKNGAIYIETSGRDWQPRLEIWREQTKLGNKEVPCPMPKGHPMFKEKIKGED
jgi:hypothetical protein